MWSNLNESFSAITDHISSLRNSLIDQQQEQSSDSNSNHRELELKISLLKNEIIRHREIAKTYKDRWLEAEKCCQKVLGHFSQTYNDDIDFREDANDETEDRCELEERDSLQTSPSNERLLKNFEQTECGNEIKQSIDLHARVEHKHFANLSIDSASKLILSLQDEIVRLRTDGEHWRKLAKEDRNEQCQYLHQKCLDLAKQNEDYECELQKLDFLHEQERSKLLALRSELLHENQQLRQQLSDEKLKEAKDFGCQTLGPNYEQIFKIANIHWDPSDPNVSVDDITAKLCEKITFLSRNNMTLLNAQQHPLEMPSHYDPINDQSTCLGNEKIENDNQNVPIDDHLDKLSLREEPEGSFSDQQIVESVDEPSNNERLVDGERNTFATLNELKLLKEDLDKKEMECIDFRKRLIENKTEIESKESRLIEMKHQYEILQDQFNVIESQLNTQLNENQKDRIDLKKFKTQCEKLTIDVENSANDFKKLTIVLAAKESELSEMRKRLESIDLTEKSSEKDSLIQIKQDQIEQLTSELDRLRKHLVETEEIYSSYLKESQNNIETYEVRLREQEAINSTLVQKDLERENSFLKLHEKLEECSNRKHLLEDENEQLKANLIDYQSVIEQLEKEHQRNISSINTEYQKQISINEKSLKESRRQLKICEEHLMETRQALEAASRLNEKIEEKESLIESLQSDLKEKNEELNLILIEMKEKDSRNEGKIDKQIVKNLILSYLATPIDKRSEGDRLLAKVLDFNQEEMDRVGIRIGRDRKSLDNSFMSKFVNFLESESSPQKNIASLNEISNSNSQQIELAKDLNKRLNQCETKTKTHQPRINLYVGQPSKSSHSNYSPIGPQQNQLLSNIENSINQSKILFHPLSESNSSNI